MKYFFLITGTNFHFLFLKAVQSKLNINFYFFSLLFLNAQNTRDVQERYYYVLFG